MQGNWGRKQQPRGRRGAAGTCSDRQGFLSATEGVGVHTSVHEASKCTVERKKRERKRAPKCNHRPPKRSCGRLLLIAPPRLEYLMHSCSCAPGSASQVLLALLLSDLVEGGARLRRGRRRHRLPRPVVDQLVQVVGERASLVVAVVGLDLSESVDWLRMRRRRRGRGGGARRLRLARDRLCRGSVERRP